MSSLLRELKAKHPLFSNNQIETLLDHFLEILEENLIKRNNNEEILSTIDSEIFSETTSSNLVISKEQTTNTIETHYSINQN